VFFVCERHEEIFPHEETRVGEHMQRFGKPTTGTPNQQISKLP
jgi:hypothetical protein